MIKPIALLVALLLGMAPAARAGTTPSPSDAECYIGWPTDGAVVKSPFKVWFGLRNMGIAPKDVSHVKTGHHHLLVDTDLPSFDEPIPADRNHLHFGGGETETELELPPGKHTLQLLMGDDKHIPHNPPVYSKKITITVK
jgi:hypothetical protein